MIPKIIHLCWMSGDPYPEKIEKCLNSWKNKLHDYEIKLWDSNTFDVGITKWTKQAYDLKQYAFVADYVRFYALYNYGGIYLDSDIEVLKSFDDLLNNHFFFGYEYTALPEAAVVGSEAGTEWLKKCIEFYDSNEFLNKDGTMNRVIAPIIMKNGFESYYNVRLLDNELINRIDGGIIFPYDYFSAKNGFTGKLLITDRTVCIHHFNSAWLKKSLGVKFKKIIHRTLIMILNKKLYNKLLYRIRSKNSNNRIK